MVSRISIKHKYFYLVLSCVCVQLNGFKYCYVTLTIQFNISHLLAYSKIVKQFYLTHRHYRYYLRGWVRGDPGSNGNEGVLHMAQIFRTEASLLDGLLSYTGLLDGLLSYIGHSLKVGRGLAVGVFYTPRRLVLNRNT